MDRSTVRPLLFSVEEVYHFLVSQLRDTGTAVTVFAGAGISIPPPSCLPSAANIVTCVIEALCVDEATQAHK